MEQRRIMVVEDHAQTRELLQYNLQAAGYEVRTAAGGEQGLEAMSRWRPDLVLLDIMMPDLDGLEVCRRLKRISALRTVPVIMLTARGDEVDRVVGLELGPRITWSSPSARASCSCASRTPCAGAGPTLWPPTRFGGTRGWW
jgi:two-component system phosphate regulon response regulator PhoB